MMGLTFILFAALADSIHYQYGQQLLADSSRELSFYMRIPTQTLQYILALDSVLYKYEVRLVVYDKSKKQAGGDFWVVEKLTGREARPGMFADTFRVRVPFTAARFRIRIRDFFGEEIFQAQEGLEPLGVVNSFIVYPSRLVESDSARLMFAIVNAENRRLDSLRVRLNIDPGRFVSRAIPPGLTPYSDSLRFYLGPIASGDYVLCLDVYAKGGVVETRKTGLMLRRSFFVEDRLYHEKVRQLRYIATEQEMGRLKKLPAAEREQGWNEFWKKQDENPNTDVNETRESYFARIDYAQEHFAHADRGWESDRGMIYVKYGPPDDIEYHSFELYSEDYEIWFYYRLNRKFTFVDAYGQGRFVLTSKDGKRI